MGRDTTYLYDQGSDRAAYALVDSAGAFQGSWTQLGIIASSELNDDTPVNEIQSEGRTYYSDGIRKVAFKCVFIQRDTATLELSAKTLRGKRIALLKEMNDVNTVGASKYQYLGIAIGKVRSATVLALPTPRVELNLDLEVNAAQITWDLSSATSLGFNATMTGNLVTPTNDYYAFKELT